jgi:hypothetical protein
VKRQGDCGEAKRSHLKSKFNVLIKAHLKKSELDNRLTKRRSREMVEKR